MIDLVDNDRLNVFRRFGVGLIIQGIINGVAAGIENKEIESAVQSMPELVNEMQLFREKTATQAYSKEYDLIFFSLKDLMLFLSTDKGDKKEELAQSILDLNYKTQSVVKKLDDKLHESKVKIEKSQNKVIELIEIA